MKYKIFDKPNMPVLVLVFGFSMSIEDWIDFGYISQLESAFHIVAIDPLGNGYRDFSYDPEDYSLDLISSTIKEIMDDLSIKQAVLWGYSLGAKILLHFTWTNPEKVSGLVLGGFEMHSEVNLADDIVLETLELGNQKWLELWQSMFCVPKPMADRLLTVDVQALKALRLAEATWPDLSNVSSSVQVKSLFYAGENCFFRKQTEAAGSLFPNSIFMEIPSKNHFESMHSSKTLCERVVAMFSRDI